MKNKSKKDIKKCYHKDDKGDKSVLVVPEIKLSSKHKGTLARIFERPERSNIEWREVEGLLKALGGTVKEGDGSRKRVTLNETRAVFHEPHPEKELDKGAVKSLRKYIEGSGLVDDKGNLVTLKK